MLYRVIIQTATPDGLGGGVLTGQCVDETAGLRAGYRRSGTLGRQLLQRDEVIQQVTIEVPYVRGG